MTRRWAWNAFAAGLAAIAGAGLGGCGGREADGEAANPPGTMAPVPSLTISRPTNGAVLRRLRRVGGHREAKVVVRGVTQPRRAVEITATCLQRRCVQQVRATGRGRFAVGMTLRIASGQRQATVVASPVDRLGAPTVVLLTVGPQQASRGSRAARRPAGRPVAPTDPGPATADSPPVPPPVGATAAGGAVQVIGDSLAQGTAPFLGGLLPGWTVRTDARRSRPLAEGLAVLDASGAPPPIVAFSLFTNDAPGNVAALSAAVRRSVAAVGGGGCVVWATVRRPPVGGRTYDAANAELARLARELAGRLQLVDWAAATAARPQLLTPDGVHATQLGYRERARLYAEAITRCAGR